MNHFCTFVAILCMCFLVVVPTISAHVIQSSDSGEEAVVTEVLLAQKQVSAKKQQQKKATVDNERLQNKKLTKEGKSVPLNGKGKIQPEKKDIGMSPLVKGDTKVIKNTNVEGKKDVQSVEETKVAKKTDTQSKLDQLNHVNPQKSLNLLESDSGVKIYIYDLPAKYNKAWVDKPHTNSEMVEFETKMEALIRNSHHFTEDMSKATHFYMPIYAVTQCAVLKKQQNSLGCKRSRGFVSEAVKYVQKTYSSNWQRNNGSDHLFATGYDYGACFATFEKDANEWGRLPELKNVRVISYLDPESSNTNCASSHDIMLPPYVPQTMQSLLSDSTTSTRPTRVYLRTANPERSPSRKELTQSFKEMSDAIVTTTAVPLKQYAKELQRSKFCLAPHGFAPWSFRFSEAVLAGCVPVLPETPRFACDGGEMRDAVVMYTGSGIGLKERLLELEKDTKFMSTAQMNLKMARKYFEYGTTTVQCLVNQIK